MVVFVPIEAAFGRIPTPSGLLNFYSRNLLGHLFRRGVR